MANQRTLRTRTAAAAVVIAFTIALAGNPPPALADNPADIVCSITSKMLKSWIKGAWKVRYASGFAAAVGFVAKQECKDAVQRLTDGEPASIEVDDGPEFRLPVQRISFLDLQPTELPAYIAPPNLSGSLGGAFDQAAAQYNYDLKMCSGYRYQVFFDQCMQGRLEAVNS